MRLRSAVLSIFLAVRKRRRFGKRYGEREGRILIAAAEAQA